MDYGTAGGAYQSIIHTDAEFEPENFFAPDSKMSAVYGTAGGGYQSITHMDSAYDHFFFSGCIFCGTVIFRARIRRYS